MFIWFTRNLNLLIGGLVLLPFILFSALMTLGLGVGFSDEAYSNSFKLVLAAISYVGVYILSIWFSLRSFKKRGNYGYWDFMPIFFFLASLMLFVISNHDT